MPADEVLLSANAAPGPTIAAPSFVRPHPETETALCRTDGYFRNLYLSEPNFNQLGTQDADFALLYVDHGLAGSVCDGLPLTLQFLFFFAFAVSRTAASWTSATQLL